MHKYKQTPLLWRPLTRIFLLSALLLLSLFLWKINTANAATGINEQINYQGRLLTNTGAVVPDGSYNMEFKVYQDGDGVLGGGDETLKWTETRESGNKVVVKNGYFSVYLGSVTAFASNVDWNQSILWLSINIGGTGSPSYDGQMSPFTRLSSSPYALNSGKLGGLTSGQYLQLAQGIQTDSSNSNASLAVNKTGSADLITLQSSGADVLTVSNTGATLFKNQSNSTTAFQIQNATAADTLFTANTSTNKITIGNATGTDTNTTLLVVDTSTADPTSNLVEGAIFYRSDTDKFRCYQASAWTDCIGAGGSTTLQGAYDIGNTISTTDARNILFTLTEQTTDPSFVINLACTTCGANTGRFAVQDAATDVFRVEPNGTAWFRSSSDSTTAFQLQNAASSSLLTGDTSNMKITVTGDITETFRQLTYSGGADASGSANSGTGDSIFNSITVSGRYAYVAKGSNATACSQSAGSAIGCELQVYDITNPGSPTYVGGADVSGSTNSGTGNAAFDSITVSGRYAYVAKGSNATACSQTAGSAIGCELQVYDISNPSAPTYIGGADASGSTNAGTGSSAFNSTFISGRYAYVAKASDATACSQTAGSAIGCELQVYDITNPAVPTYAGGADASGSANSGTGNIAMNSVFASGRYLYATKAADATACSQTAGSAIGCELQVYDLSNPASPSYIGGADATGSTNSGTGNIGSNSIFVSGRYAYATKSFDNTTCSQTPGSAIGCELQVYAISNPASPTYVGGADSSGLTNSGTGNSGFFDITVSGRYAYTIKGGSATACSQTAGSAIGCELQAYDVSNPATPTYIGGADASGSTNSGTGNSGSNSVTASGRYVYVAKAGDATTCSQTPGSAIGCELQTYNVTGTEAVSLTAHALDAGTLQVNDTAQFDQQVTIRDGLSVGQGLEITGDLGASGKALFKNTTNSTTAFQIQNAASENVLNINTDNTWNLSTAEYNSLSFSVNGQEDGTTGVAFKSDGTKMYVIGTSGDAVYQYSLSTAWNVSTASYDSVSFATASQDITVHSITFKADGTKMYLMGNANDTVYQYSLSTAWNMSTASYDSVSFSVTSQENDPRSVSFKSDGTKMYIIGQTGDTVYQYSLSTAWNVSTAAYDTVSFSVASQDTTPQEIIFKSDGTKMFVMGNANDTVYQYSLSTAWSMSTASYDSVSFSVASHESSSNALAFSSDGSSMYIAGASSDTVYQYSVYSPGGLSIYGETLFLDGTTTYARFDDSGITITPINGSDVTLSLDNDSSLITNGTVTDTGFLHDINLTLGNDAAADTVSALNIDVTSAATADADILYALNIGALSSADSTVYEAGLHIGTGWDNAIDSEGNVLIGMQANDSGHTFTSGCSCSLNSAAGTFGSQTARDGVTASVIYRGKLFVAVKETDAAGIYRYDGGTTWTLVTNAVGKAVSGDTANIDAYVMTVWNDTLYIGSQTAAGTGALYDSTNADGGSPSFTLRQATRGTFASTLTGIDGISDLVVYNGALYLGTQEANLAEVDRYDGGNTMVQVSNTTEGRIGTLASTTTDGVSFAVWGGRLYAGNFTGSGGNAARVSTYTGVGTTWTDLTTTAGSIGAETGVDDITNLAIWGGSLYAATGETDLANIYKWDAPLYSVDTTPATWRKVNNASGKVTSGDTANIDSIILKTYRGRLYAGSTNSATGALYEYDSAPGSWTLINGTRGTFGAETSVDAITAIQEWNGSLYVGISEADKGSVYSWSKADDQSYALRFEGPTDNLGAIRFIGSEQAIDNQGRQGTFNFTHGITMSSGAFDYAEDYPTLDYALEPGEPVAVDPNHKEHVKRAKPGETVLGVVSENPGFRLSSNVQPETGAKWLPIALVGRVPVKVTTHEGQAPIKPGDSLALSTIPGVLEKAQASSGAIVGVALEGYDGEAISKVSLYVSPQIKLSTLDFDDQQTQAGLDLTGNSLTITDETGVNKVEIDNQGNAFFAGTITADRIRANSIEGLEILTDKLDSLSTRVASSDNNVVTPANNNVSITKLNVQTLTIALDLNVNGSVTVGAGLTVGGPAEFKAQTTFQKLALFIDRVVFRSDVSFEGHVSFNQDSGGVAIIKQGASRVEVRFKNAYPEAPIINANYEFEDSKKADSSLDSVEDKQARLSEAGYNYVIGRVTPDGFTILLNKPASEDVQFHWLARSVKYVAEN